MAFWSGPAVMAFSKLTESSNACGDDLKLVVATWYGSPELYECRTQGQGSRVGETAGSAKQDCRPSGVGLHTGASSRTRWHCWRRTEYNARALAVANSHCNAVAESGAQQLLHRLADEFSPQVNAPTVEIRAASRASVPASSIW